MDYSPSPPPRGRYASRSPTPYSRSPSPPTRGRPRSITRSPLPSRSPSPRRNGGRYRSTSRSWSRGRASSESPLRGSTKIVVEKLTKTINEDHLREIFGHYGPIKDLDLPMNRQFNTNRGTAYILYDHKTDAEDAIAHMHEAQVDGATINVSIVLPRRTFSPSPPLASRGANIDPRNPPPRGPGGPGGRRGGRRGAGGFGGRSPQPRFGSGGGRGGANRADASDVYRPRSRSRSPPPQRRGRSPSAKSYGSRSRSPPRRRGARKDSYDNGSVDRHRHTGFDSFRDRSRTRSRGGRGYR